MDKCRLWTLPALASLHAQEVSAAHGARIQEKAHRCVARLPRHSSRGCSPTSDFLLRGPPEGPLSLDGDGLGTEPPARAQGRGAQLCGSGEAPGVHCHYHGVAVIAWRAGEQLAGSPTGCPSVSALERCAGLASWGGEQGQLGSLQLRGRVKK